MKEATGELNLGLITIIAIGVMAAFFYTVIWPSLNRNFQKNISCDKALCDKDSLENGKYQNCYLYDKSKNIDTSNNVGPCPYKG